MKKLCATALAVAALVTAHAKGSVELPPNRGKFLILIFGVGNEFSAIVGMDFARKWIVQTWNRYDPTYDFVLAVADRSDAGCKVSFTRYVMQADYVAREEHTVAHFPYNRQDRQSFFDRGYVIGFYRNSFEDFDHRKLIFPHSSNQAMQRTPTRRSPKISND
jgi:hypothetical protein